MGYRRRTFVRGTPEQRFWAKVKKDAPDGCWLWMSTIMKNGYGHFRVGAKKVYAHRFSYVLANGPIQTGCDLDHLCRVRHCVNPSHLEAVPRRVNLLRGETLVAANARKTHCPQGHPYTQDNTYTYHGSRQCMTCRTERDRNRARASR